MAHQTIFTHALTCCSPRPQHGTQAAARNKTKNDRTCTWQPGHRTDTLAQCLRNTDGALNEQVTRTGLICLQRLTLVVSTTAHPTRLKHAWTSSGGCTPKSPPWHQVQVGACSVIFLNRCSFVGHGCLTCPKATLSSSPDPQTSWLSFVQQVSTVA